MSSAISVSEDKGFSRERHGPWAVIAGASDGLGAAFARQVAAAGINCVLVARRLPALQALATALTAEFGVEAVAASIDLSTADATEKMLATIGDREIGLLIFNAGADTSGKHFTDLPLADWEGLLRRNINTFMSTCYAFAQRLSDLGRGGMLLVNSTASLGGGARVAMYTATKAFQLNLGESLWAELSPRNIDVLNVIFGAATTPTFQGVLERQGIPAASVGEVPTPEQIAAKAVAEFRNGPTFIYGADVGVADAADGGAQRKQHVETVTNYMNFFYGKS